MLKKILFSAPGLGHSPSKSADRLVGPGSGRLASLALIPALVLILIGLTPQDLPAQSGDPSEITAGPISVKSVPAEVAPLPEVPPTQSAPQAQQPAAPSQPPAGLVPPTFSTKAPAPASPTPAPATPAPVTTAPVTPAPASVEPVLVEAAPAAQTPDPAPSQAEAAPAELPQGAELTEINKELAKADTSYRQGDYIGALDALWAAQEMMWRRAPLGVRNVAFVTEQPENFGSYKPKAGETFQSSEPLILYCEPIGFTQIKENDTYKYSIIGAFDILGSDGQVLGGQKNLGPYEQSGYRTFSTETMLVMTIGIRGLAAGSYIMRVTLTDNLDRTKSVQLDKLFNIVE